MYMKNGVIPNTSIDSELEEHQVLWRYLDLAKFVELIRSQSLCLSRVDKFQDKFEGSFTPSIKAAIEGAYKSSKSEFNYEKFKTELRESVYVSCWSLGDNDNMALWEIYGKSSASVAITTTVGKFRKVLMKPQLSGTVSLSKVEYIKHSHDPKINIIPYSNVFRYKGVAYDFEREVRVINDKLEQNFQKPDKDENIFLQLNLCDLLCNIIVSPSAKPWFIELIKDITQKYGITTPISQSELALAPI